MAQLLTQTEYQRITGVAYEGDDFDTVEARIVERIEGVMDRAFVSAERTEYATRHWDGWLHPTATPVTAVHSSTVHRAFNNGGILLPAWGWEGSHEVTYTGGYTVLTAPAPLKQAVAYAIQTAVQSAVPEQAGVGVEGVPAGVKQLSIAGEYSVTLTDAAARDGLGGDGLPVPAGMEHARDLGGRALALLMRYRRPVIA